MASLPKNPKPETFTLAVLMQHAGKLLEDRLRAGFDGIGLHLSQGRVLHLLGRRGSFEQQELAVMMRVSAPTVSGILKRMEAEGLVKRSPDAHDDRVTCVSLTRKGHQKGRAAEAVVNEVEQTLIAGLSQSQLRSAHSLLRQLRNNLGGEPPGHEPAVQKIIP